MNIKEIVRQYLDSNGYDGLFSEGECCCPIDDLFPCGDIQPDCTAGYECPCPETCGEHDYHIGEEKPE